MTLAHGSGPTATLTRPLGRGTRNVHDFARKFETPAIFGFSSDAQDMFRPWMIEAQTEARSGKLLSVLESHILKMPKTVAALALIFELADGGAIGSVAMGRALGWADYLRSHATRLYFAGSVMVETGRASSSNNCRNVSRPGISIRKHGQGLPIETPQWRR
jgi:hypothetical protein